jgi:hypothetical protein
MEVSSMTRRLLLLVPCVLLLGSALLAPSQGTGQRRARAATIAGTWRYDGPAAQGAEIVRQAVEPVVGMMDPRLQPVARERIAESTWLPTQIRIGAQRTRLEVALTGRERRTFRSAPGRMISVPMRAGQYAQLTQMIRPDGSLQQDFVAIDGVQQNIYVPTGRTMVLDVTLRSQALPTEIHFQLNYRRAR